MNDLLSKLTPTLFLSNGIQIEQSKDARKDYHKEIADAVAEVMCSRIKVCTGTGIRGFRSLDLPHEQHRRQRASSVAQCCAAG